MKIFQKMFSDELSNLRTNFASSAADSFKSDRESRTFRGVNTL